MRIRVRVQPRASRSAFAGEHRSRRIMGRLTKVLLVFVDGVGLGPADRSRNAFAAAPPPALRLLLDGRVSALENAPFLGQRASLIPLDATFGVEGTPQSGTGQTALLTGRDAVRLHGRHFGPWVPTRLRPLLLEENVLARAKRAGRDVAFANAYPEELVEAGRRALRDGSRLPPYLRAGPPLAALGAGVLTRHTAELERGDAIASEITNDGWITQLGRTGVSRRSAVEAGGLLVRIAAEHHLTLFAHYATDTAGHRRDLAAAIIALQRFDEFVRGIIEALDEDTLLIIASDHGNLEDCTTGHTRNPALCVVAGRGHAELAGSLHDLTDITPAILAVLRVQGSPAELAE
ncbi:MAG: alkaline phosphatase family protein [Longimicrobiales bacterium]